MLARCLLGFLLAVCCVALAQESQPVQFYHRVISYTAAPEQQPSWTKRGSWSTEGWLPEDSSFSTLPAGDLYQIGFATSENAVTNFVSVPECHLHTSAAKPLQDSITLTLPSLNVNKPIHLQYKVDRADGTSCQSGQRAATFNTSIHLDYPQRVDAPKLHEPLIVNYQADGTVEEPEPEKTFLQKYWLYILPMALIVLTSL